jgi:hypothetical protein
MRSVYCCAIYVTSNSIKDTQIFLEIAPYFYNFIHVWSSATDFHKVPGIKYHEHLASSIRSDNVERH